MQVHKILRLIHVKAVDMLKGDLSRAFPPKSTAFAIRINYRKIFQIGIT